MRAFSRKTIKHVVYIFLLLLLLGTIAVLRRTLLHYRALERIRKFEIRLKGPLSDDNNYLIEYVRKRVLHPPSTSEYNLEIDKASTQYNSYRITEISWMYLYKQLRLLYPRGSLTDGFFIEAGALDGEYNSNTLYLEKKLGWTGLLVEPDRELIKILRAKNRRSWSCHCCLATKLYPYQTVLSKIMKYGPKKRNFAAKVRVFNSVIESKSNIQRLGYGYEELETVQCLPLQTLLAALNRSHVDVISLDIEDIEQEVLDTFPFDRITVDVWLVEHRHPSSQHIMQKDPIDSQFIDNFKRNGYFLYEVSPHSPRDYIFIRQASSVYQSTMNSSSSIGHFHR